MRFGGNGTVPIRTNEPANATVIDGSWAVQDRRYTFACLLRMVHFVVPAHTKNGSSCPDEGPEELEHND